MLLVPAIDIKQRRCVRLYQGKYEKETEYNLDPVAVAVDFRKRGAKRLHVVDLDGAVKDKSSNLDIIRDICSNVDIPVEMGGGIRDIKSAKEIIDLGISEVILGTLVIKSPDTAVEIIKELGPERIQIGFDYSGDHIAVKGWQELVRGSVVNEIKKWQVYKVERYILTDITKDGTMIGPNVKSLKDIAEHTDVLITAAGGVSCPEDIEKLSSLENVGVDRVISGKAIYENKIRIEDYS
ncbi:1-(5-phosphoribosyl)-5-[(5-phosphoribosylamino)methylideneamino]imidazole-4-carboxamide isomerase [candidate division KSB1 bacterium]